MQKFSIWNWKKEELLMVMSILIVVIGISFFQLKLGEVKTRDAQRKADVELVARALEKYFADHKIFPVGEKGQIVSCGDDGNEVCVWGEGAITDEDNVVYLKQLPREPFWEKGRIYYYEPSTDRTSFKIFVALENSRDEDWKKGLTEECGNGLQCNWYVENQI